MALRKTFFFIIIFFLFALKPGYAGRYLYNQQTGVFDKKSKEEKYHVKIIQKRKKNRTKFSIKESMASRWSPFHNLQRENANFDLHFLQFIKDIKKQIHDIEEHYSSFEIPLDRFLKLEILRSKRRALKYELDRKKPSPYFFEFFPRNSIYEQQQRDRARKLGLYNRLNPEALAAYIDERTESIFNFMHDLRQRNQELGQALKALPPGHGINVASLRPLKIQIDKDHALIKNFPRNVLIESHYFPKCPVDAEKNANLSFSYLDIIQEHGELYDEITSLMSQAKAEEEPEKVKVGYEIDINDILNQIGSAVKMPVMIAAFVVASPVLLPGLVAYGIYDQGKDTYGKFKRERQRRINAHRKFCEHAYVHWIGLSKDLSLEEQEIYQRSFEKFTHEKYQTSEIDFAYAATENARLRVQQRRVLIELDQHMTSLNSNESLLPQVRQKFRRALWRAQIAVRVTPRKSFKERYTAPSIENRILASENKKLEKRERRRNVKDDRQTAARDKQQKQKEYQRRLAIFKTELLKKHAQPNQDEIDVILVRLLQSRFKNSAYRKIFGDSTFKQMVKNFKANDFEEFWNIVRSNYASRVENILAQRELRRKRAMNLVNNRRALHAYVQQIENKSRDNLSASELMFRLFNQRLTYGNFINKKTNKKIFGNVDLSAVLKECDNFEELQNTLKQRYEEKVQSIIDQHKDTERRGRNKRLNRRECRKHAQIARQKHKNERSDEEHLITLFTDALSSWPSPTARFVFSDNLSPHLEEHDCYEDLMKTLVINYGERAQEQRAKFLLEQQQLLNKTNNIRLLKQRVREIKNSKASEETETTLLILLHRFIRCPSSSFFRRHKIFTEHEVIAVLESHSSFDEFLEAICQRYNQNIVDYLSQEDHERLLTLAQRGLSFINVVAVRQQAFNSFDAELDRLNERLDFPTTPAPKPFTPRKKRTQEGFNEILASQDIYRERLQGYSADVVVKENAEHSDDEIPEENDNIEIVKKEAQRYFEDWYEPLPPSPHTAIHVEKECQICFTEELAYDLVFSSANQKTLAPAQLLQHPHRGTHKMSRCGHLFCDACVGMMEANAKKIKSNVTLKENIFSAFSCPLCQKNVPCDELDRREFLKAYGYPMHSPIADRE